MMSLDELKRQSMQSPSFKQAYDALDEEFKFIETLIEMRQKAGLSQDQIAQKMGGLEKVAFFVLNRVMAIPVGKHCRSMQMLVGLRLRCRIIN